MDAQIHSAGAASQRGLMPRSRLTNALRALALSALVLVSSGCGLKFAYNNADRLVQWWVSDYIDLEDPQRAYLRAAVRDFMYWHRTTQLAAYRTELLAFSEQLSGPIETAEFVALLERLDGFSDPIALRAAPIAAQVLLSLSPEQLQGFQEALRKSNQEYLDEAERDLEKRWKEQAKDYAWLFRRLTGRLSNDQLQLIANSHRSLVPFEAPLVAYREVWQGEILRLLAAETPNPQALVQMMIDSESLYPESFNAMIDQNEAVYTALTVQLLNGLSDVQRKRFRNELIDLAQLCQELIDAAGDPPTPAGLLVPYAPVASLAWDR